MKKILGILGTITIAGSGISGIVGNAPAPAKNEINYLQTNNLKKLNRSKRDKISKDNCTAEVYASAAGGGAAIGAAIGSIVPGLGTAVGVAIGFSTGPIHWHGHRGGN